MKVFIYTENLTKPFDEGIKKVAFQIISFLSEKTNIFGACRYGKNFRESSIKTINSNKFLLNSKLRKAIRKSNPDIILYIPIWCGTFASFIRMRILSIYAKKSKSVMIILQPKKISVLQTKLIRFLKPDKVYSPSPKVIKQMSEFEIDAEFLPLFVDRDKFKPLKNINKKNKLKEKYRIPSDKFIILHVGHINSGRNLDALLPLQKDNNQVLVLGSSSTSEVAFKDETLKYKLEKSGIIVIDKYLENVEEIYQVSDIYVFPTIFEQGCIGVPLSVLEAKACGLPVITTDFGGLKHLFDQNDESIIYSEPIDFQKNIDKMKKRFWTHINNDDIDRINELFRRTFIKMIED